MFVVVYTNIPGWHTDQTEEITDINYRPILGVFSSREKAIKAAVKYNLTSFGCDDDIVKLITKQKSGLSAPESVDIPSSVLINSIANGPVDFLETVYNESIKIIKNKNQTPKYIVRYNEVREYPIDV